MGLDAIRRVATPGVRSSRSTLLSVLLMLAVALGLVAMHDADTEHVAHTGTFTTAPSAHADAHAIDVTEPVTTTMAAAVAAAGTAMMADCGAGCVSDVLGCVAAAMACAMMIAFAILAAVARPAMFKRLLDAGGALRVVAVEVASGHRRPDLHVLSISRT